MLRLFRKDPEMHQRQHGADFQQNRHNPDQLMSIRDTRNWRLVPDSHASLLLGLRFDRSAGKLWHVSDPLVYTVRSCSRNSSTL
jgi:hypothetical protein